MAQTQNDGELLKKWLEHVSSRAITGSMEPAKKAEKITEEMQKSLRETWGKLKSWLERGESNEIRGLCYEGAGWTRTGGVWDQYMPILCTAVAEIKYFMNGVETKKKMGTRGPLKTDDIEVEPSMADDEAYRRCIVGAVALSTVYGDHCYVREVLEKVEARANAKLKGYLSKPTMPRQLNNCGGVNLEGLLLGKTLLQDEISQWTSSTRQRTENYWRVQYLWKLWKSVCARGKESQGHETVRKENLQENKGSMLSFSGMDSRNKDLMEELISENVPLTFDDLKLALQQSIENDGGVATGTPFEVSTLLKNVDEKVHKNKAQACIQQKENGEDKSMCQRLDCMKHLWQNNTGTGGQTSSTNNFWTQETGAVAQLWKDLAKAMEGKGKDDQTGCKELPNPSDKTACNFLHAGLEHLYKTPAATAPPGGVADVLKTNPSFRQTMGCFLLHAYAKHMKEKAVCDIEKGITTAFTAWEKPEGKANSCKDSSGKGQCVPCHWQEKDETWKNCTITTNGQAPDPNGTVGDKLKNIVKADDADIKEMAKVVNTVERLCDQVKCVTARWMKDKTKSWEEVWKKVEEELPKLGGALSTATSKEKRGDLEQYCDLPKVNGKDVDKEACLLIAAGLKNLYDIEEKNNDAVEASFQRTMQCVLLNAIADKLEHNDFPCKDEKNTKKGIDEAFTTKNSAIRNSTACGTNDKCFTCGRVTLQDLESCKLDSGGTDQNVKKKIEEEVLKKDGEGMKEMTKIWDQSIKDICK
ncbi:SICAvar, type I (fragment) [Plasmodium knowlesi strain H]|uniref:SICAvar, type I n=1 Tax=Plasmodium knowlesi (strain H) TaxID=5851 RepID=A0A1A7VZL4_PLAKH